MKIKIACVQMKSELGEKEKNIVKIIGYIKAVKKENSNIDLIVFPELATTGYECSELYEEMSEIYPVGYSFERLAEAAKEQNVHIVFGFVEKAIKEGKNVLYNSAALISNKGVAIGCYQKSHLVEGGETEYFEKGKSYNVFDTEIGKIGIMICWDTAYPEVARILALKGAELIVVPAAWEEPKGGDWDIVQSARSFDNVLYIAACNHVGQDRELSFFGKSKIVGPIGRTIVEADDQERVIVGTIDYALLPELREGYYVLLKDRNPDTYGEILKK